MAAEKLLTNIRYLSHRLGYRQCTNTTNFIIPESAMRRFSAKLSEKITVLGKLFTKQCNAIAAQRIIRTSQILKLYRELYGDKSYFKLLNRFGSNFLKNAKIREFGLLFGAALFSWEKDNFTDQDLSRSAFVESI